VKPQIISVTVQELNMLYYLLLRRHHHHHHLGLGHGRSVPSSSTVCWSLHRNCGRCMFRLLLGFMVTFFFQFVCLPFVERGVLFLPCVACYTRQKFHFCCFNLCFLPYFIVQLSARLVSIGTAIASLNCILVYF
jgi:hypothetical protein